MFDRFQPTEAEIGHSPERQPKVSVTVVQNVVMDFASKRWPRAGALAGHAMYRALNAQKVTSTVEELEARITSRFPGSGLSKVCCDLAGLSRQTASRIEFVAKPNWILRVCLTAAVLLTLFTLAFLIQEAWLLKGSDQLSDVMQGLDAGMNLAVILGGAIFFISTIETRWKRVRALAALHELRSIIHVIDMHQLTKDPSMLGAARTSASPEHDLTPFELMRYLDYCSEMLSLAAKLAALYAEKLSDAIVVDTVGDIERLTSSLSSKIWQKITMVQALGGRGIPLPNAAAKPADKLIEPMGLAPNQAPKPVPAS